MSNIIHSKDDLLVLKDFLNDFMSKGLSKSIIEELLKTLLPTKDGNMLISYNLNPRGFNVAEFVSRYERINISLGNVNTWLDKNVYEFLKDTNNCDPSVLRGYLLILIVTHEIEHAYQYLIGESLVDAPNDVIKQTYKELFDLFHPDNYILPRPITKSRKVISMLLYKLKENYYLLERNANVESMDLVSQLALFNNDENIFNLFDDMKKTYLKCGYLDSNIGSIEETYRKILMYDKFKKIYHDVDLNDEDKIRFGFGISEEARKKLLLKRK